MSFIFSIIWATFLTLVLTPFIAGCIIIAWGVMTGQSLPFGWTMAAVFIVTLAITVSKARHG